MILRVLLAAVLLASAPLALAQASAFQYVGTLSDTQQPAPTGSFDFQVGLYDGSGAGAALLAPVQVLPAIAVQAGYFTLNLDFGSAVLAPEAWLQIGVRPAGSGGFDVLSPRQKLGHVPLAYYAENTDWAGVANVPAALAQLAARPSAIGDMVANANGDTASLRVRAVSFGVNRTCAPTCSPPAFEDAELLVEPGKDWWKLYKWVNEGTEEITVALHLDATGGLAANPLANFQLARVMRMKYETATGADGQDLVRIGLSFLKLTLTVASTGVAYTYDRSLVQSSAVPGICPDFFSVMLANLPPGPLPNGALLLSAPQNPLDVTGSDSGGASYTTPRLAYPLDPGAPNRWARVATCALALATTNTTLTPDPTLTYYASTDPKSEDYASRINWKVPKMTAMRVESTPQGGLVASYSMFANCVGLSVYQGQPGLYQAFGWSYASNLPCTP